MKRMAVALRRRTVVLSPQGEGGEHQRGHQHGREWGAQRRQAGRMYRGRHQRELDGGGHRREPRAGDTAGQQGGVAPRARAEGRGRCGARHEARQQAAERQPCTRPKGAQGHVAEPLERHEQHRQRPQPPRVQATQPGQRRRGNQRQHHERGTGEHQSVAQLGRAQQFGRETVEALPRVQQRGHDHRGTGRKARVLDRVHAEQVGDEQGEFRRDAGIGRALARIADGGQRQDQQAAEDHQPRQADALRDSAHHRRQRERAHARELALRAVPLAAFALDADQQARAQRGGDARQQVGGEGRGGGIHRAHCTGRDGRRLDRGDGRVSSAACRWYIRSTRNGALPRWPTA